MNKYDDFRYVEFIRNPQCSNLNLQSDENIKYVALDYFDFIYSKQVNSFKECMISENDIPCEAYQSMGLFRKKKDNESDPFKINNKCPFFSLLQITINPECHKSLHLYNEEDRNNIMSELENIVSETKDKFFLNKQDEENYLNYKVYYSINTIDFCIVLSTNYMSFSTLLSHELKQKLLKEENDYYTKYSIYTVMGINKDYIYEKNIHHLDETILVTRITLNQSFFIKSNDENNENNFSEIIENEKASHSTDSHILPGRYDFSIRINDVNCIIETLPILIKFIVNSFSGDSCLNINIDNHKINNNMLFWLIKNNYIEYLNARVFFACENIKNYNNNIEIKNSNRKPSDKIEELFKQIIEKIKNKNITKLYGYMNKIHSIIHIYIALYSRYDTHLSIKMLGQYLFNFLKLLKMNIDLASYININDLIKNLVTGINYLQQYIKIVTSVNSASFESPKYETEKDECCIVKLPIAYTQFLSSIFDEYYKKREGINDDEFEYFPKYEPLVIPYMQNGSTDFMMMTLFSQGISDNWNCIKNKWKKFNEDSYALIYIICQNMDIYKDISSLIVSSLHEIGHYCNGITRKERNSDIIKIFSSEISKEIVKKCVSMSKSNFQTQQESIKFSYIIQIFNESIYKSLVELLSSKLADFIDYPSEVFNNKLCDIINNITYVFIDYNNKKTITFDYKNISILLSEFECLFGKLDADKNKIEEIKVCSLMIETIKNQYYKLTEKVNQLCKMNKIDKIICDKTKEFLNISNKLMEVNFIKFPSNEDVSVQENIYKYAMELFEISKYFHLNIYSYENSDIKMLKEFLIEIKNCISFCCKISTYLINDILFEKTYQNIPISQIISNVKLKEEFIDTIVKSYHYNIMSKPVFQKESNDYFFNIYRDLYLYPNDDQAKLKEILNNALSGLDIYDGNLEIGKLCYEESLADIVMCLNLNLSLIEYIIDASETFELNNLTLTRLIIVMSFLLFEKEINQLHNKEKMISENELLIQIKDEFKKRFLHEMKLFKRKAKFKHMTKTILNYYLPEMENKLFIVTFKRLIKCYKNIKFVDENAVSFVKDKIKLKCFPYSKSKEEINEIQSREINFILNCYYTNRYKYAKYNYLGEN